MPSQSANKKLPILDLQCWMEKLHGSNKVYYKFYHKPMSNRLLMMSQSSMPEKVKKTTLIQENIRILRNCHPDLPWKEKLVHLNEFTERMRESGYEERMRKEVIESGLKGYQRMIDVERNGGRPVNRLRGN